VVTAAADTQVYDGGLKAVVKLAKDTKVQGGWSAAANGVSYNNITVNGAAPQWRDRVHQDRRPQGSGRRDANTKLPVADVQVLSDAQETE